MFGLLALLGVAYLLVLPVIAIAAYQRSGRLEGELDALRRAFAALSRSVAAAPAVTEPSAAVPTPVPDLQPVVTDAPPPSAAPRPTVATRSPFPEPPRPVATGPWPQPQPQPQPEAAPPLPKLAPLPPGDAPSRPLAGLVSWFLAGNPLAKLGVLLLFFGVAYLVRYAAERQLLPIELRLAGAALGATGMLALGWVLRRRQALFGLILQGGAVGALYIICFAASKLYSLLPQLASFGLMLLICASSVLLAVLQRAQSLAVLASLGGYLAPVLLSDGSGSHLGLFSYYALLSGGIVAVAATQAWRALNLVGFVFTFGVGTLWGVRDYQPELYLGCQLFLVLNLLIYGVLAVLFALRSEAHSGRGLLDGTLVFGTPLVGFGLQYGLTQRWEYGPALSALGFAAFYLPLALTLLRRWPEQARGLTVSFLALGAGFATLAIPLALSAQWTSMAWALEGLGLLWAGRSQHERRMAWSGSALLVLAALTAVLALHDGLDTPGFLTIFAVLALTWLGAARLWATGEDGLLRADTLGERRPPALLFLAGGITAWLVWLAEGADRLAPGHAAPMLALAGITASALLWAWAAHRLTWRSLGLCTWLLWPFAAVVLLAQLSDLEHPLGAGAWALAWPPALALAYSLLAREDRTPTLPAWASGSLHASLVWGLLLLSGSELHDLVERASGAHDSWRLGALLAHAALAVALIWWLAARARWPVAAHPRSYWLAGLAPTLLPFGWGLVAGNLNDGRIATLGYLPLINPLEQGALAALLMLWVWQRHAAVGRWPRIAVLALAAWWANGLLLRSLARLGGLDWASDTLWHSSLVQTSLAIAWTLAALACMVLARRQANRPIWFAGATLLGVVLLKLFLVDAAGGGGLARAVAFIGVAVLLLVIGYFTPLPPRSDQEVQT